MLEKIKNYFIGSDVINYYNELKEKYPEYSKQINQERNENIFFWKIVPNLIDAGGIFSLCTGEIVGGLVTLGVGEGTRYFSKRDFQKKKKEYSKSKSLDNTLVKLIIEEINLLQPTK